MAVATVTFTRTGRRVLPAAIQVEASAAISANPDTYAASGLPIVWGNIGGSTKPPIPGTTRFTGKAGYVFEYDDAASKLWIRQAAAAANPLAEIPVAAIPAGLSGDAIKVVTQFPKFG